MSDSHETDTLRRREHMRRGQNNANTDIVAPRLSLHPRPTMNRPDVCIGQDSHHTKCAKASVACTDVRQTLLDSAHAKQQRNELFDAHFIMAIPWRTHRARKDTYGSNKISLPQSRVARRCQSTGPRRHRGARERAAERTRERAGHRKAAQHRLTT